MCNIGNSYIVSNNDFQCETFGANPYQLGEQLSCETLEAEFDICHNSIAGADWRGWELKGKRVRNVLQATRSSRVTLMTPEPDGGLYSSNFGEFMSLYGHKRNKDEEGNYLTWEEHLLSISPDINEFKKRKKIISQHIQSENYPNLSEDERNALKAVCEHLYSSTKSELDKSLELFKNIDKTLVNKR